jgi:hypothetical protein
MRRERQQRWSIRIATAVLAINAAGVACADQAMRMRRLPSGPAPATDAAPVVQPAVPQQNADNGASAPANPVVTCSIDGSPRISSLNGRQYGDIEFKPGDSISLLGCGFTSSGQAYLSGGGTSISLKIDSWTDSSIHARIDAALSGQVDFGAARINVKPNGGALLSSIDNNRFTAAREQHEIALPPNEGTYATLYGAPTTTIEQLGVALKSGGSEPAPLDTTKERERTPPPDEPGQAASAATVMALHSQEQVGPNRQKREGSVTRVRREWVVREGFCPAVSNQLTQMVDTWSTAFLADTTEVLGANYDNQTRQDNADTEQVQWVMVGAAGGAQYDASQKRITVTFQGNSAYVKKLTAGEVLKGLVLPDIAVKNLLHTSGSVCTSDYAVSLLVSSPRGVSPIK